MTTLKRIAGKRNEIKIFFVKTGRRKGRNLLFASKSDASTKNNVWYVDSGCSNQITRNEKAFLSINNSITTNVRMGNEALVDAKGKCINSINMKGSGKQIHDVLYMEENFLNVGQLMERGYSLVFRDNYCIIYVKIEPNQVIVDVKIIKRNFPLIFHYSALKMKL